MTATALPQGWQVRAIFEVVIVTSTLESPRKVAVKEVAQLSATATCRFASSRPGHGARRLAA